MLSLASLGRACLQQLMLCHETVNDTSGLGLQTRVSSSLKHSARADSDGTASIYTTQPTEQCQNLIPELQWLLGMPGEPVEQSCVMRATSSSKVSCPLLAHGTVGPPSMRSWLIEKAVYN